MTRAHPLSVLALTLVVTPAVLADGGLFLTNPSADLAQTRQEVLIAFHAGAAGDSQRYATYVLMSRYSGEPESLAWIIPVPNTPTDVQALADDALFAALDTYTQPRFTITSGQSNYGCGCTSLSTDGTTGNLVVVEARGQAGIFDWAALTSTGGTALLTWLSDNNFAVSTTAATVLDGYIQDNWHFLALRVREPESVTAATGEIEIPPIQFTCQTARRVYPMVISQVSAAAEVEVVVYVLADHRAAASNVENTTIPPDEIAYDPSSTSLTNYEQLFRAAIAAGSGRTLITEYAGLSSGSGWLAQFDWLEAPAGVAELQYLTRLRTVIAPEDMTVDFEFQDAATDESVHSDFYVQRSYTATLGNLFAITAAALLPYGLLRTALRRRVRTA